MINYFEIFGFQQDYFIAKDRLEQEYFKLQMQAHPDRMIGKTEAEKKALLGTSANVNEGYGILNDDVRRAEFLLELNGVRVNHERDNDFQPSQALLVEQMELRERAGEIESGLENKAELLSHVDAEFENEKKEFNKYFSKKLFAQAAESAMRLKYLEKLKDELEKL